MTVEELARLVGGVVHGRADLELRGAEVDSRRVEPGDLFVAVAGERRDGHEFVAAALEVATAALVRDDVALAAAPEGRALIRVTDPLAALQELASRERRARGWRVAAITGSVGKTTTKTLLASLLEPHFATGSTAESRNSQLGLPSEILSQPSGIEIFVAEAGMSRAGELTTLGEILRPDALLYTRIAPVHTEFFPDVAAIAEAKAELLPWLDGDGTLIVNADDPRQSDYPRRTTARVIDYGAPQSQARIEAYQDLGLLGSRFRLVLPTGESPVELRMAGGHQAENLLAAAAAASAFGVQADQVAASAGALRAEPHRGRILQLADEITVVDDSYNASPVAVRRLLDLLRRAPGRRVAVLGEMYELGELAQRAHEEAGREAAAACDVLVVVGEANAARVAAAARAAGLADAMVHDVSDAEEATALLTRLLRPGDVVLVKGSRAVGLDRTVTALAGEEAA
jgi:UDP-N-acetylmuramoyl-tripeptide--D-alanyl-D-alanine ligase